MEIGSGSDSQRTRMAGGAPSIPGMGARDAVSAAPPQAVSFERVLAGLAQEVDVGERRVRGALGVASTSAALGPSELIALQAGVYRYSEVVDLSARLIDHAASGLKTVLQGQ